MNSISKIILLSLFYTTALYGNRLKLKKADVLESKNVGKESVKYLTGNVEFQKGLVQLKCDYGTHKEKEDIAHLFDNVEVTKENLSLTCDSITFYSKQNKVESTGNPKVVDLEYNLKSDTLILEGDKDLAYTQLVNKRYYSPDFLILAYTPKEGLLSKNTIETIENISAKLLQITNVDSVTSILNVPIFFGSYLLWIL